MVRRRLFTKTFPSFSFSVAEGFITHASKRNSLFLGGNRSHVKPSGEYISSFDTQLLRLYLMTYLIGALLNAELIVLAFLLLSKLTAYKKN